MSALPGESFCPPDRESGLRSPLISSNLMPFITSKWSFYRHRPAMLCTHAFRLPGLILAFIAAVALDQVHHPYFGPSQDVLSSPGRCVHKNVG